MKHILNVILLVSILSLFLMTGCQSATKIGDILADPTKYESQEVTIKGTVGETAWFTAAEKGVYQMGDGSGNIWVLTTQPPPQKGMTVSSTGKAQAAFSFLGKSYGTIIEETKRN